MPSNGLRIARLKEMCSPRRFYPSRQSHGSLSFPHGRARRQNMPHPAGRLGVCQGRFRHSPVKPGRPPFSSEASGGCLSRSQGFAALRRRLAERAASARDTAPTWEIKLNCRSRGAVTIEPGATLVTLWLVSSLREAATQIDTVCGCACNRGGVERTAVERTSMKRLRFAGNESA